MDSCTLPPVIATNISDSDWKGTGSLLCGRELSRPIPSLLLLVVPKWMILNSVLFCTRPICRWLGCRLGGGDSVRNSTQRTLLYMSDFESALCHITTMLADCYHVYHNVGVRWGITYLLAVHPALLRLDELQTPPLKAYQSSIVYGRRLDSDKRLLTYLHILATLYTIAQSVFPTYRRLLQGHSRTLEGGSSGGFVFMIFIKVVVIPVTWQL